MTHHLTRRTLLSAAAALPLAHAAQASAPLLGASSALHRRFILGNFEVTTLLAASATRDDPHSIFGLNVDEAAFRSAAEAAMLPVDQAQFFFTPTIVNTGAELVLFDTGLNAAGITSALAAAGYTPDQVDVVVITHMHGDHIGGLREGDTSTFPNARYVTGAKEYDAWAGMESDAFNGKMRPLADQTTMIMPGQTVAPGITAMAAFGHTPGHMAYMIESEGVSLLLAADFANHYVFSLGYPDWEVKFDMDKSAAAATRRSLLDMLAADRIPFIGYHMPFPAIGFVETRGEGFGYIPESYQLRL
ncbi:MBL fold metallo-hydrolase [Pseudohalocynthiibacter aestuariivivens]|nr:MBL fold metallo-hydrolase [Pseudohalocynthiibacter aestuariivivens]QIE45576.1 MBL fold metallo-hydrolase [Pseudohalocynthiibacter aestuariivivens]